MLISTIVIQEARERLTIENIVTTYDDMLRALAANGEETTQKTCGLPFSDGRPLVRQQGQCSDGFERAI